MLENQFLKNCTIYIICLWLFYTVLFFQTKWKLRFFLYVLIHLIEHTIKYVFAVNNTVNIWYICCCNFLLNDYVTYNILIKWFILTKKTTLLNIIYLNWELISFVFGSQLKIIFQTEIVRNNYNIYSNSFLKHFFI